MLRLTESVETFAAERTAAQDEAAEVLRPLVAAALTDGDWTPVTNQFVALVRAGAATVDDEVSAPDDDPLLTEALIAVTSSLSRTTNTPPDSRQREIQVDAISQWLATMALNAGTEVAAAANRDVLRLEWVTMGDDDVRQAHRNVNGQRRNLGDTFEVEGFQFHYPGQPVGPPALWIRCRCSLRPVGLTEGLTAAAEAQRTESVIVALPAADDPVREIGPEEKHATLLYFGDQDIDPDRIGKILTGAGFPAFTDDVTGRDTLGEDEADVVLIESEGHLSRLREALLGHEYLAELTAGVEQYPSYTPHVTLGYPSEGWERDGQVPLQIRFDRLGLWQGENRWEFDMSTPTEDDEPVNDFDPASLSPIPIHGVLAIEGAPTGDWRSLLEGEITWRNLPVALRYAPVDNGGHDGAVIAGRIDDIWREGDLLQFDGIMDDSEDASEALRLIAEKFLRGVSVDLDSVEAYANEETGNSDVIGRIAAATIVQIPAFQEAYVALGPHPSKTEQAEPAFAISEKPWDGDASRFTLQEYHRACIVHLHSGDPESKSECKLPIREPNGDLSRAGVHAAAARINQTDAPDEQIRKAKASLRSAYKELGDDPPEVIQAAQGTSEFVPADVGIPGERGPGWITHPEETNRLHDYWTRGPGAAKIAWGTPNDFYRCRRQLAKYVEPQYINATCAEWHHDALGIWPGQHSVKGETMSTDAMVAAATFTSSPPKSWFEDPGLSEPTALTITEDGRVYGHVATWGTCHIGAKGECIEPPRSANDYGYFHTGLIETEDGPVSVGTLSMGGGHADLSGTYRSAVAHYDSTSTAVAYLRLGEDEHGIWMAGMTRPGLSDEDLFALRAAGTVSGDWRAIGSMEPRDLVAVLAVNVPGFPVPRPALAASGAGVRSLVAVNTVMANEEDAPSVAAQVRTALRAEKAREKMRALRVDRAKAALTGKED